MHRWMKHLFIAAYLAVLGYGLVIHTLKINRYSHMANYFFVWDMYCGWNAFEKRSVLIGQGESGQYYNLNPPWQTLRPFGDAHRHNFDSWGYFSGQVAANTLKQTQHEPMTRVFLIEQHWAKKYNLPDHLWSRRFDTPKDPKVYHYLRTVFDPSGTPTERHSDWKTNLQFHAVIDNPALRSTVARSRPYLGTDQLFRPDVSNIQQASFQVSE